MIKQLEDHAQSDNQGFAKIPYLICLSADSLPACADETAVAGISEAALTPRRAKADVCSAEDEAWADSLATEVDLADPS